VTFYAEKPDGHALFNACTVTDAVNGKCTYKVTTQTSAAAGTLKAQIVITWSSGAEKRSEEFIVTVKPSLDITGAVESTDEFTQLQQALATVGNIPNLIYPVGSIYLSVNPVNPSTLFGGTWVSIGAGRALVGVDASQSEFNTVEKIGGAKTHTLTVDQMPIHSHAPKGITTPTGGAVRFQATTGSFTDMVSLSQDCLANAGNGVAHNNLQPYITCYIWKRTA
jgi:hypothetical protein